MVVVSILEKQRIYNTSVKSCKQQDWYSYCVNKMMQFWTCDNDEQTGSGGTVSSVLAVVDNRSVWLLVDEIKPEQMDGDNIIRNGNSDHNIREMKLACNLGKL